MQLSVAGWYSSVQLARLGLPWLPRHQPNIARKATLEGWPHQRHPWLPHGRLFHVACLPDVPRAALVEQLRLQGVALEGAFPAPAPAAPARADPRRPAAGGDRRSPRGAIAGDPEVERIVLGMLAAHPHASARHVQAAVLERTGKTLH